MKLAAVVAIVLAAGPAAAQSPTGEYVLLHEGTEAMKVKLRSVESGRVTGEAVAAGIAMPFSGTFDGRTLRFSTTSPDGSRVRWQASISGAVFNATLTDDAGSQAVALTRRGAGWSSDSRLASEWTARLSGRQLSLTERTGGGSAGGATKDMTVTFCPNARLVYDEAFSLNVAVPGMGGGGTSRGSEEGRWRVITRGNVASVEATTAGKEVMQLGVRSGDEGIVYLGMQAFRTSPARERCR